MIIFLDFDGVLRRAAAPPYRLEADLVLNFEQAVRRIPDVQIVISSSWRDIFPLDALRGLFSPDIAQKIVGVLPADDPHTEYPRYAAIKSYLKDAELKDATWLALDDASHLFPVNCPNLILVGTQGFDEDAAKRLVAKNQ